MRTWTVGKMGRKAGMGLFGLGAWFAQVALAVALCPPYPPPANGIVSSAASTPVGVPIVITCDNGFKAVGRASPSCAQYPPTGDSGGYDAARGNRTAAERNGYQNGATCEPISCGRFPAPENARVQPEGAVGFGSRAHIICAPGFRAVGLPGSSQTPLCQSDGSFEMGKRCQRIQLDCLSSVATAADKISDGQDAYQNETCHPDTQFCVTAVKGSTVWRGCGPPVVTIGDEVVPHSDWLSEVTAGGRGQKKG